MLLVVVTRGLFRETSALGIIFSSHVWSTVCDAIIWPRVRLTCGVIRWIVAGKKPSMLEKWWAGRTGVCLNCLLVRDASSSANRRPRAVTVRAISFRLVGIVITGVLRGRMLEVISKPAMMLPQASRLIGLITAGLFSLIGDSELNRGWPMETKKTIRRL